MLCYSVSDGVPVVRKEDFSGSLGFSDGASPEADSEQQDQVLQKREQGRSSQGINLPMFGVTLLVRLSLMLCDFVFLPD